jgi:ABC-type branched-subunit amino acid transport system ATPase component
MSAPFVIETSGLTKRFGRRIAVDDVDLRVPRGSAVGYLGPNGLGDNSLQPNGLVARFSRSGRLADDPTVERGP